MQTLKTPKNIVIVNPVVKAKSSHKMTKEEYFAMLDESRAQWERGEFTRVKPEDFKKFLGLE